MSKKGELLVGTVASTVKMIGQSVLVRRVIVEPTKKRKTGLLSASGASMDEASEMYSIQDFGGYHPFLVEVIAVGPEAKTVKSGDIAIPVQRLKPFFDGMETDPSRLPIEPVFMDGEMFFR